MQSDDLMQLSVGGQLFSLERRQLALHPHSRLALLTDASPSYHVTSGVHLLTADPRHVPAILAAYTEGRVRFARGTSALDAMAQLEYWGLAPDLLEPGVRHQYQRELDQVVVLAGVLPDEPVRSGWRGSLHNSLRFPRKSIWITMWVLTCHLLALVSLALFTAKIKLRLTFKPYKVLTSSSPDHTPALVEDDVDDAHLPWLMQPYVLYYCIEVPITLVLLVEHVLCSLAAAYSGKWYGFFNDMAMLGVYPVIVSTLLLLVTQMEAKYEWGMSMGLLAGSAVFMYWLTLCRAFRFIEALRHFKCARVLLCALIASWRHLLACFIFLTIATPIFSILVFFVESSSEQSHYRNALTAVWWAAQTLTTVGYGDMRPISSLGKLVAAMCMLCGVLTIATCTAVVTTQLKHIQELARGLPALSSEDHTCLRTRTSPAAHGEEQTCLNAMTATGGGEQTCMCVQIRRYMASLKSAAVPFAKMNPIRSMPESGGSTA